MSAEDSRAYDDKEAQHRPLPTPDCQARGRAADQTSSVCRSNNDTRSNITRLADSVTERYGVPAVTRGNDMPHDVYLKTEYWFSNSACGSPEYERQSTDHREGSLSDAGTSRSAARTVDCAESGTRSCRLGAILNKCRLRRDASRVGSWQRMRGCAASALFRCQWVCGRMKRHLPTWTFRRQCIVTS